MARAASATSPIRCWARRTSPGCAPTSTSATIRPPRARTSGALPALEGAVWALVEELAAGGRRLLRWRARSLTARMVRLHKQCDYVRVLDQALGQVEQVANVYAGPDRPRSVS